MGGRWGKDAEWISGVELSALDRVMFEPAASEQTLRGGGSRGLL